MPSPQPQQEPALPGTPGSPPPTTMIKVMNHFLFCHRCHLQSPPQVCPAHAQPRRAAEPTLPWERSYSTSQSQRGSFWGDNKSSAHLHPTTLHWKQKHLTQNLQTAGGPCPPRPLRVFLLGSSIITPKKSLHIHRHSPKTRGIAILLPCGSQISQMLLRCLL